jgi:hypothetical protein
MDDRMIKNAKTGEIVTKTIGNVENDNKISITVDRGMYSEYIYQLGKKSYVAGGKRWFEKEIDMINCAAHFDDTGNLSKNRPATDAQISYMRFLEIDYDPCWTVIEARNAIDNKLQDKK